MVTPSTSKHNVTYLARLDAGAACHKAALKFRSMGLSPIILCDPDHIGIAKVNPRHNCDTPGKAPIFRWKEYQTTPPTDDVINGWYKRYPIGNVGLICGHGTGVMRIDSDGEHGERLLAAWSQGDLPKTWIFQTVNSPSPQWLYRWPEGIFCRSTASMGKGGHNELRLIGTGSQTVVPPSRHPSGGLYQWVPGFSPDDIDLAMAPAWLVERMRTDSPHTSQEADIPDDLPEVDINALPIEQAIRNLIRHGTPDGDRSADLYKVLTSLIKAGFPDGALFAILTNPDNGISSKPLEKGARWTRQEIGRIRADVKQGMTATEGGRPSNSPAVPKPADQTGPVEKILSALARKPKGAKPKELADLTGLDRQIVSMNVNRLIRAKKPKVKRTPKGRYTLTPYGKNTVQDETPDTRDQVPTQQESEQPELTDDTHAQNDRAHPATEKKESSERPQININTEVTLITNQGQKAILNMPSGPHLFQRARRLCFIAKGIRAPKWMSRPSDAPVIVEASSATIRELAAKAVAWMKYDRRSKKWYETLPPAWFIETLRNGV